MTTDKSGASVDHIKNGHRCCTVSTMYESISESYRDLIDRRSHAQRQIDPARQVNADRRISVRVTAAQYEGLEQRAIELRLTVADLVRQLVGV
jgi:hypothetical protein